MLGLTISRAMTLGGSVPLGNVISAVISGLEGGAAIVGSTLTASINGLEGGEVVTGPEWFLDGVSVSTADSYVVPAGASLRLAYTVDGVERGRTVTVAQATAKIINVTFGVNEINIEYDGALTLGFGENEITAEVA